jgi:hypothetical protein
VQQPEHSLTHLFLLFAKYLKIFSFFAFMFKVRKMCYGKQKSIGYPKTKNFMLISNLLIPALKNAHIKALGKNSANIFLHIFEVFCV